jgi:hypothetical protein
LRKELAAMNIMACAALRDAKNGQRVTVSGLVLVRQMPGSAKGVMFITLENDTDIRNGERDFHGETRSVGKPVLSQSLRMPATFRSPLTSA